MPEHSECPICGSTNVYFLGRHVFMKKAFMWGCRHCGAVYGEEIVQGRGR